MFLTSPAVCFAVVEKVARTVNRIKPNIQPIRIVSVAIFCISYFICIFVGKPQKQTQYDKG